MAPVLKTGIPERVSGVRIPLSPPDPKLVLRLCCAAFRISARDSDAAQTPKVRIPLSARIRPALLNSQVLFAREHGQLQSTRHPQLAVDIAQMPLDRLFADGELPGDLAVTAALLDGGDNFNFA